MKFVEDGGEKEEKKKWFGEEREEAKTPDMGPR